MNKLIFSAKTALVLIGLSLIFAGCTFLSKQGTSSSSSKSQSSSTQYSMTPRVSSESALCSLITGTDLSKIMGASFQNPTLDVSGCSAHSSDNRQYVMFDAHAGKPCGLSDAPDSRCAAFAKSVFSANKTFDQQHGKTVTSISGLGSEAYCSSSTDSLGNQSASVQVVQGNLNLDAYTDTCEQAEQIMQILLNGIY